jgi:hypothetical protein
MRLMGLCADLHVTDAQRTSDALLRRELATYHPGREREDLLASACRVPGNEADQVRELLSRSSSPPAYAFMRVT